MEIPEGWKRTKLGQHVKIHAGVAPANLEFNETDGIPYVKVEDMNNCSKIQKLSRAYVVKLPHPVPAGCVIFPKRGAAIMNNKVRISGTKIVIDTNMMALETNSITDSEFLYYFVIFKKLFKIADTSTIPQINNKHILPYVFLSPPLPEQKKIAKILSTWDWAIEVVERLIKNSQAQKKALMQQLLTGKKRLPGFDGEWETTVLSRVAQIIMGSSPKSTAYNDEKIGLPLLQGNADIKNRLSAPRIYTSQVTKECLVDDILLSVRAPVGEVSRSVHDACIGRGISAIRAKDNAVQEFVYQWLLFFEPKWARFSQGSTFEAVNSSDIRTLKLCIPSKDEQKKIATTLSDADRETELLAQQLTQLKSEKSALMQQLLTGKHRVKIDKEDAA